MTLLRCLILFLMMEVAVAAETLRDPTQLPDSVMNATALDESSAQQGPTLQSIILSDAMRAAIINGQRVNIGEDFGSSTLIALTENSATLQTVDGAHTVLKMPHIKFGAKETEQMTNVIKTVGR